MNNKKLITFLGIGLVVLIGAGALILSSNKKAEPVVSQEPLEEQITQIKPEDIGLTLTATTGNRAVILEVKNTKGLAGLDYELSYISKGDIQRGAMGRIAIPENGMPAKAEITLGTCSDVCHYDEDVSDVKLILKIAKTDGTTSQTEKSLEL